MMPGSALINVCSGVLYVNLAKEVKRIKAIHYTCSNFVIFCNGHEKTFASLANAQYYNFIFYTGFDLL